MKAQLDTSDVKRKLDELKKQTKEAAQGSQPGGGANGLSAELRALNSAIQRLQASIDRLALQQKGGGGSASARGSGLTFAAGRPFGV